MWLQKLTIWCVSQIIGTDSWVTAVDVLTDNIMWHLVGRSRLASAVSSHWCLVRIFSFQDLCDHSIGFQTKTVEDHSLTDCKLVSISLW